MYNECVFPFTPEQKIQMELNGQIRPDPDEYLPKDGYLSTDNYPTTGVVSNNISFHGFGSLANLIQRGDFVPTHESEVKEKKEERFWKGSRK